MAHSPSQYQGGDPQLLPQSPLDLGSDRNCLFYALIFSANTAYIDKRGREIHWLERNETESLNFFWLSWGPGDGVEPALDRDLN